VAGHVGCRDERDLTLVHVRLEDDQEKPDKHFYWNRLALSHFTEAALFLHDTVDIVEVRSFVESLSEDARDKHAECLTIFDEYRGRLFDVRNKATFHYPELRPMDPHAARPVRDSLLSFRESRGVIRAGRLRDSRALFADEVLAATFLRLLGGEEGVIAFAERVADGVTAFIRFANLALDEYLTRRVADGAALEPVEPVDPSDLRAGWQAAT
jgi:hypothetical protein